MMLYKGTYMLFKCPRCRHEEYVNFTFNDMDMFKMIERMENEPCPKCGFAHDEVVLGLQGEGEYAN